LTERIKPVVVVNKVDRFLLELNADPEEMLHTFSQSIDNVNMIVAIQTDPEGTMENFLVSPAEATLCFVWDCMDLDSHGVGLRNAIGRSLEFRCPL
jgi:elongation factor 2